ncbi:MAG: endo-1,4-beta-xylanase [Polyangiaceae bacterium]
MKRRSIGSVGAKRLGPGRWAPCLAAVCLWACSSSETVPSAPAVATMAVEGAQCGFSVTSKIHGESKKGFHVLVDVTNVSGDPSTTGFSVFVSAGAAALVNVAHGSFEVVEGGYLLKPLESIESSRLEPGQSYSMGLKFEGVYTSFTPVVLSNNEINCDQEAPTVKLTASSDFFTANGSLTLSADATDNANLAKVVFTRDGQTIGIDTTAPYSLDVPISSALNGRHRFAAAAYDLTGNTAAESKRVLVAIDNKFFGMAADVAADYTNWRSDFAQLTVGNAGKWGSVESTRDVMNWTGLDEAYQFAKVRGIPFKMHTLIWGQQQPAWLATLTPEEQLAEIEQWMTAVAERYPDLNLIDVVNEPINSPPAYAAALGGAGSTGYDWVIKAFEMARAHFPNAELILNEYNTLIMRDFPSGWLKLVGLLKERGLIDGIGEQAHFLEKATVASVTANLDTIAATGLPIYITELDLNFADDAQQANVMSQLFPVFWSNPSVLGVTHWGYLQGAMWRQNAYLVRGDGTTRPAYDWLRCYVAGNTDCAVPPYVRGLRTGDDTVLMLEAEDFDAAEGLVAGGGSVSYTDAGDWERFDRVAFKANYNKLSVAYAKGSSDTTSTLTIHLDGLENAPVATVALPTTGGWGVTRKAEAVWPPVSGEHTVYVRFNGSYGVGNVDSLTFSARSSNLVLNGTFEAGLGTSGWDKNNGGVEVSSARSHSGSYSLRHYGRSATWAGAQANLTAVATRGASYPVSFWVSVGNTTTAQQIKLTQTYNCGAGTKYEQVAAAVNATDGQWVQLKGVANVPDCAFSSFNVYPEGPAAGVDIYIDDVKILTPEGNLLAPGSFESGATEGFSAWRGSIANTSERAHGGNFSLKNTASGQPMFVHGVSGLVQGKSYLASMWLSTSSASAVNVHLQAQYQCAGAGTQYSSYYANPSVPSGNGWTKLVGLFTVTCPLSWFNLYAEAGASDMTLYLDDVLVSPVTFD